MKLATPLKVNSDLSEAALEDAWNQAGRPDNFSLIVGTKLVTVARSLRLNNKHLRIWVNPEWTSEWMLSCAYNCSVFSEAF